MAADDVLADLLALSAQVREVVVLGASGFVVACSTTPERGEELACTAAALLAVAEQHRSGGAAVTRVEVLGEAGGVFVVRDDGRVICASTVAEATPGLVVYDLRTTLARVDERARGGVGDA
jgi:predicted regulator of Ras-like GTPase activity (Roadblock/LC7/MglB family)